MFARNLSRRSRSQIVVATMLTGAAIAVFVYVKVSDDGSANAAWAARNLRRAYHGAPPVVAHPPQSGKCIRCHTATGAARPPLGLAPANPHQNTRGVNAESNCRQCHAFQKSDDVFVENDFESVTVAMSGSRAYSHAPPTIPHRIFMREACAACHTGEAARPGIRCTHPNRSRCLQCHAVKSTADEFTAAGDFLANRNVKP
jgi:nitrate reductase (cytochrome), electron transfer subunit